MDEAFSELSMDAGLAPAYERFADAELRYYRMNLPPLNSLDSVLEHLSDSAEPWSFTPKASEVSRSADMGYSFGTARLGGDDSSYVHVWRKVEGNWKLALAIMIPNTPPKKG